MGQLLKQVRASKAGSKKVIPQPADDKAKLTRNVFAIAVAALLLSTGLFAFLYLRAAQNVTTVTSTTTLTTTAVSDVYGCVQQISGLSSVHFDNGSEAAIPQPSCLSETSHYYAVISYLESDPKFVSLENGSDFVFYDGSLTSSMSNGISSDQFIFQYYVTNDTFSGCGGEAIETSVLVSEIYADVVVSANYTYYLPSAEIGVVSPILLHTSMEGCNLAPFSEPFWMIPGNFSYGGYLLTMTYNGTSYQPPGSSSAGSGYDMVLKVAYRNQTQSVDVHWDTERPMEVPSLPSPASYFALGHVNMTWAFLGYRQTSSGPLPQLCLNVTLMPTISIP